MFCQYLSSQLIEDFILACTRYKSVNLDGFFLETVIPLKKKTFPQKDKTSSQNTYVDELDEVKNDIYRASKKNFMTTRKTADVLRYYDSLIKM